MKRSFLFAALFLFAAASFAGTTYDFHNDTEDKLVGQRPTLEGSVAVDGPNMKVTITRSDHMTFKPGWFVLSRDGGKTIAVYDPAQKTVFEMRSEDLVEKLSTALQNSVMKLKTGKPSVTVKDAGDGGVLEGFPTNKSQLDASIDLTWSADDRSVTLTMSLHDESWTTDKLDPNDLVFFERANSTGIEGLDTMIAAQTAEMKGRFPLKSVSTMHINMMGNDRVAMITTSTVTNVKRQALDAATFAPPEGYRHIENPLRKPKR